MGKSLSTSEKWIQKLSEQKQSSFSQDGRIGKCIHILPQAHQTIKQP